MQRVLVTGAGGRIGRMLREHLPREGRELLLTDVVPVDAPGAQVLDVTDLRAVVAACAGVDAVVHLGGTPADVGWDEVVQTNVQGTYCVFEAARRAGVPRVVYASSNHAVGFRANAPELPDDVPMRPDTFYGVGKVVGEALGSLYHDRHGLDVVCLRIGTCYPEPPDFRSLSTWLSPGDAARLVDASLTAPHPGFRIVWGISRNTRRVWSLAGGAALGYHPQDDAEAYAYTVPPVEPVVEKAGREFVGGQFTL